MPNEHRGCVAYLYGNDLKEPGTNGFPADIKSIYIRIVYTHTSIRSYSIVPLHELNYLGI